MKVTITMQQKINWMLFLTFGISIIANLSACRKDYALTVEWVYINETDSSISFFPPRNDYNLNPNSSTSDIDITEADQNVDISNVGVPLNVYVIFYSNSLCDTLLGKSGIELGPSAIENYEVEKRGDNNFKCTFRYTEQAIQRAKICK